MAEKILLLDGISGVPLGSQLKEAIISEGVDTVYADLRKFPVRTLYGSRAVLSKILNKWEKKDSFYHFPKLNEIEFEAYLAKQRPTILLVIGFIYKYLSPEYVIKLKAKYGFKLFLYDTDSCNLYSKRREFIFFIENELSIYDHIFSFSKVTTRFFIDTKCLSASFMPYGADIVFLKQVDSPKIDVLFVGSCDLRRIFLLEQIKNNVTVYGDRWKRNYPLISEALRANVNDESIWGEALYQKMADAKIVLNITRTQFYGAETGVNLRIFEALAAGCFLLTDYCDELAELFKIGEEIEVFRTSKELAEKVEFYLNNAEKRKAIAKKGHARYLANYSWQARAKVLLKAMDLTS